MPPSLRFIPTAALAAILAACSPEIDAVDPPAPSSFSDSQIRNGARLAAMGNCITCHTTDGGKPFAGGRPIPTPFGTLYATNITPDPETGIGRWSQAAFERAMREGLDREGRHLYPAFPYDNYTKLTDTDIGDIYAFLMTREPIRAEAKDNELTFPLNFRPLLAGWKLMFLDEGAYEANAAKDGEWNRGAYLVEGIAHCGACHSPRNWAGAVKRSEPLAGGDVEGWHAPALNAASVAPIPWDRDSLVAYLRDGWHAEHGAAAGPMRPVIDNLATVPEEDLVAMATYLETIGGQASARQGAGAELASRSAGVDPGTPVSIDPAHPDGRALYVATCASCHESGRDMRLALSTDLHLQDPANFIHFILDGIHPGEGEVGRTMPGFASVLTDAQVAAVSNYLREELAGRDQWSKIEERVRDMRAKRDREGDIR